jgi:hypothetical protein
LGALIPEFLRFDCVLQVCKRNICSDFERIIPFFISKFQSVHNFKKATIRV